VTLKRVGGEGAPQLCHLTHTLHLEDASRAMLLRLGAADASGGEAMRYGKRSR
jgi:hypothetical protein